MSQTSSSAPRLTLKSNEPQTTSRTEGLIMNVTELAEHFAMPGVLAFHETPSGLVYIEITTPHAKATVYLQGAHLTHWQPFNNGVAAQPIIFLSRKSDLTPGKTIRGGVPIIF